MTDTKPARYFQVGVRLSQQEYEAVKREAKRRGWSLGQVMRRRALKGLTVVAPEVGEADALKAVGQ